MSIPVGGSDLFVDLSGIIQMLMGVLQISPTC
jgi:hypothetical protein